MLRYQLNRRMTFVLALLVCLAIAAPQFTAPAYAVQVNEEPNDDNGGSSTPRGDPDLPTGPTKTLRTGSQRGAVSTFRNRTVGDGSATSVSWAWRLRIVLRSLQAYGLHF